MHDVVEKNFKVFRPIEYGINFYSDCLVTTQQELQENPKRVHKIREATIKGWEYAIKHPQEIVELIHTKYNSNLSLDDLKKESEIVLNSLLIPNLYVFGTSDKMRWENMNKVLIDLKIIKVPLDLNRLLYNPKTENTEQLRYFLKIALLVLMVIGIILLVAIFYNFQLKKAIAKKTLELKNINIELENLNMFRAKMLAMISHDTKGPIHNLKGIIHLFNNGSLDLESFKKLFLEVENKLDEVSMFLDNILRWSKQNFHKNEQTINTKKLELTAITQKIISLFSFEIKKKSINIENNIDTNVLLFADENMLNTILRNLLSNAIKFSNFEGNIKIYTTPCENGIKVNIKDNGMGMTESQLKDIFTENVISTEGSKQEVGTGLGLLLCKQYAELHNGKIGAESQLNKGSTFWFELPLEPTPAVTMHRE